MTQEVNQIVSFVFDTEAAKTASVGYKVGDLFKVALVKDTGAMYILTSTFPATWESLGSGGGSSLAVKQDILVGASAGTSSAWLPVVPYAERLAYALVSGSTNTTFSVDVSVDGVTLLSQAFTGSWASSATAEITAPILFSALTARYFRINVLSGGPITFIRGV